jgi:hypothetical protein
MPKVLEMHGMMGQRHEVLHEHTLVRVMQGERALMFEEGLRPCYGLGQILGSWYDVHVVQNRSKTLRWPRQHSVLFSESLDVSIVPCPSISYSLLTNR